MSPSSLPVLITSVILILTSFCSGSPVLPPDDPSSNSSSFMSILTDPLNDFSISLFDHLCHEGDGQDNVFLSPVSVSTAVSMLLLGARASSQSQLRSLLNADRIEDNENNRTIHNLMHELIERRIDASDGLSLSNFLMIRKESGNNAIQTQFKSDLESQYHATVQDVDFVTKGDEAMTAANDWVRTRTKGLIKKMLDHAPEPDTRAISMNTMFFKGKWEQPFSKGQNERLSFYNKGLNEKSVEFMVQSQTRVPHSVMRVNGQEVQVVELGYANDSLSMILILPNDRQGLRTILSSNRSKSDLMYMQQVIRGLNESRSVNLFVPKFKLEAKYNLKTPLSGMGVTDVFNSNVADLSGVNGQRNLFVSEIRHKTVIRVDEEGTEAGTSLTDPPLVPAAVLEPAVDFRADHPFIFLIRDRESGLVFFIGKLEQL